jgi:hypothetical protein
MQNGFSSLPQTNFVFPFAFLIFEFVSDFDIRISDLPGAVGSGFAWFGSTDLPNALLYSPRLCAILRPNALANGQCFPPDAPLEGCVRARLRDHSALVTFASCNQGVQRHPVQPLPDLSLFQQGSSFQASFPKIEF